MTTIEAQVRTLIDGPARRRHRRWITLTTVDELRGLGPTSVLRVKGQLTTADLYGPTFLRRMIRAGVKIELPW